MLQPIEAPAFLQRVSFAYCSSCCKAAETYARGKILDRGWAGPFAAAPGCARAYLARAIPCTMAWFSTDSDPGDQLAHIFAVSSTFGKPEFLSLVCSTCEHQALLQEPDMPNSFTAYPAPCNGAIQWKLHNIGTRSNKERPSAQPVVHSFTPCSQPTAQARVSTSHCYCSGGCSVKQPQ
jgi:hypothetical protein